MSDLKYFKKPRVLCAQCNRTVSLTARGGLAAHQCKHGRACVEANSGAQVNQCRLCKPTEVQP